MAPDAKQRLAPPLLLGARALVQEADAVLSVAPRAGSVDLGEVHREVVGGRVHRSGRCAVGARVREQVDRQSCACLADWDEDDRGRAPTACDDRAYVGLFIASMPRRRMATSTPWMCSSSGTGRTFEWKLKMALAGAANPLGEVVARWRARWRGRRRAPGARLRRDVAHARDDDLERWGPARRRSGGSRPR